MRQAASQLHERSVELASIAGVDGAKHRFRLREIDASGQECIRPILNYYNPTGSSRFVHGQTVRDTYPTRHSHANVVVVDSGWDEQDRDRGEEAGSPDHDGGSSSGGGDIPARSGIYA